MPAKKPSDEAVFSETFDVYPCLETPEERAACKRAIKADLATYRAVARRAAAICMAAELAGAKIEQREEGILLLPQKEKSKNVLSTIFEHTGQRHAYELYKHVRELLDGNNNAGWKSNIACEIIKIISGWFWRKDPQFPTVGTGYLAMQGARRLPLFNYLPLPLRGPSQQKKRECVIEGRNFIVSYKNGEEIPLALAGSRSKSADGQRGGKRIDASRYYIFKKIQSGEWICNTAYLHEKDNDLRLRVCYRVPISEKAALDDRRAAAVSFTSSPEEVMRIQVLDGLKPNVVFKANGASVPLDVVRQEGISAIAAIAQMSRLRKQQERFFNEQRACGDRKDMKRGSGNEKARKAAVERRQRLTARRENAAKTWNHRWSSMIVARAKEWKCKKIVFYGPPAPVTPKSPKIEQGLLGWPWQWHDFVQKLTYKAEREGMELQIISPVDVKETLEKTLA